MTRIPSPRDQTDLGFLCSPSFLYLRGQERPSIELVPAGFVFADRRHRGEPVYYSDVVVRADHAARRFEDLEGGVWGFNDECSLSGYFATLQELARLGTNGGFFGRWERTGSHPASIEATLDGRIDGAAIDSVALSFLLREQPELHARLRILTSFGPFPIQPVVVRSELSTEWAPRIAASLRDLIGGSDPCLTRYGLHGCVRIDEGHYQEEHEALCSLGCLAR